MQSCVGINGYIYNTHDMIAFGPINIMLIMQHTSIVTKSALITSLHSTYPSPCIIIQFLYALMIHIQLQILDPNTKVIPSSQRRNKMQNDNYYQYSLLIILLSLNQQSLNDVIPTLPFFVHLPQKLFVAI